MNCCTAGLLTVCCTVVQLVADCCTGHRWFGDCCTVALFMADCCTAALFSGDLGGGGAARNPSFCEIRCRIELTYARAMSVSATWCGPSTGTRRMMVVVAVDHLHGRRGQAGSAKTTAGHSSFRRETGPSASILVTFSNTTKRTFDLALDRFKHATVWKSVDILSLAFDSSLCSDCGTAFRNVGMMARLTRSAHEPEVVTICTPWRKGLDPYVNTQRDRRHLTAPGLRFEVTAWDFILFCHR
jgi:hypothetical protein